MSAAHKSESPAATGLNAEQTNSKHTSIIRHAGEAGNPAGNALPLEEFRQLRARFAKRGYSLQRVYRADDGRASFHIMRSSKTCVLSHPHDVRAYLAQIEESPL